MNTSKGRTGPFHKTTNGNVMKTNFPEDVFFSRYTYSEGHFIWLHDYRNIKTGDQAKEQNNGNGYLYLTIKSKKYYIHRLVFFYFNRRFPKYVDHVNKNKKDNRIENLRECTHSENHGNRKPKNKLRGVSYNIKHKNWKVRIYTVKGNFHGTFKTKEEAVKAYNEKAVLFFGSFAELNKC